MHDTVKKALYGHFGTIPTGTTHVGNDGRNPRWYRWDRATDEWQWCESAGGHWNASHEAKYTSCFSQEKLIPLETRHPAPEQSPTRDELIEALTVAMDYIELSPCDPDIVPRQKKAWDRLQSLNPRKLLTAAKYGDS